MFYPIQIKKDTNGQFLATSRDIPVASVGDTVEDVCRNAVDGFKKAFEFYKELGLEIPKPSAREYGEVLIEVGHVMNKFEVFALSQVLAWWSPCMSFDEIMEAIIEDSPHVGVWEPLANMDKTMLAEYIENMALQASKLVDVSHENE